MRIEKSVFITLSGILLVGASTSALAGPYNANYGVACGGNVGCKSALNQRVIAYEGVRNTRCNQGLVALPSTDCTATVVNHGSAADPLAPVNHYSSAPYGFLKTFEYKNTPDVNITRVYARPDMAPLNATPTQISGGCTPTSGAYCRAPQPMIRAPMPRPAMMRAPIVARPLQIRTGSGFNASNFAPRQIGDNVLTPGIAHIPTSIVDRSPITHIDGVPQQQVSSVVTTRGVNVPRPMPLRGGNVIGHVSGGSYTYQPQGQSNYWEKTSGPTIVNGLPATQILCRRQGARPAPITVNISRPVIGVPRPVPTPYAVPVRTAQACAPAPMMGRPAMPRHPMSANPGSRWTY